MLKEAQRVSKPCFNCSLHNSPCALWHRPLCAALRACSDRLRPCVALNGINVTLCKTNDLFCDRGALTATLRLWSPAAAWKWLCCCCYIVYKEGQSRVCTWLFRWWFTCILSSWVIEWLSHFPFMRKVAIYGERSSPCRIPLPPPEAPRFSL